MSAHAQTFLPVVLVALAMTAMACAPSDESDTTSASQNVTSDAVALKTVIARVIELAPAGVYLGKTPAGKACVVTVDETQVKSGSKLDVVANEGERFVGAKIHPALSAADNWFVPHAETPVRKYESGAETVSFEVDNREYAGEDHDPKTDYFVKITVSSLKKPAGFITVVHPGEEPLQCSALRPAKEDDYKPTPGGSD